MSDGENDGVETLCDVFFNEEDVKKFVKELYVDSGKSKILFGSKALGTVIGVDIYKINGTAVKLTNWKDKNIERFSEEGEKSGNEELRMRNKAADQHAYKRYLELKEHFEGDSSSGVEYE